VVQFDGADGECLAIRMEGGECWGQHPVNGGSYDCMGRCGAGCGSWPCSNWGPDCLKHDVCSWYFTAWGLFLDQRCGDEAWDAKDDAVQQCAWWGTQQCEGPSSSCHLVSAAHSVLGQQMTDALDDNGGDPDEFSRSPWYIQNQNVLILALLMSVMHMALCGCCWCSMMRTKYLSVDMPTDLEEVEEFEE